MTKLQLNELVDHYGRLRNRQETLHKQQASLHDGLARVKSGMAKLESYQDEIRGHELRQQEDLQDQELIDARSVCEVAGQPNDVGSCASPGITSPIAEEWFAETGGAVPLPQESARVQSRQWCFGQMQALARSQDARLLSFSVSGAHDSPAVSLQLRLESGESLGLQVIQGERGLRVSLRGIPALARAGSSRRIEDALRRDGFELEDLILEDV